MDFRNAENEARTLDLRHLETEREHAERWSSIRIMYFTVFLMSLGFSIVLTGVWPYLHQVGLRPITLTYKFSANGFASQYLPQNLECKGFPNQIENFLNLIYLFFHLKLKIFEGKFLV